MDCLVDKELAERLHATSCGQRIDVQVETSDEWHSLGVSTGTSADLTSLWAAWTVGLGVPSANLQMTPSCVVRLTHWREEMPSRGTWMA